VQGADAAPIIARRIEQANCWKLADVLIVGRGGGSLEDLLPFSEECVVRAIAASTIPVISAVGHEIDWALSDFAADLRAPTPSAAAELVSENYSDTLNGVRAFRQTICRTIRSRVERASLLTKPFRSGYLMQAFRSILQPRIMRLDDAKETLLLAATSRTANLRRRIEIAHATLEAASPRSILERGFSVVVNKSTGAIVRDSSETSKDDILDIRLARGRIQAKTL
jgi:exodeoxyribonuclease VII large subunit